VLDLQARVGLDERERAVARVDEKLARRQAAQTGRRAECERRLHERSAQPGASCGAGAISSSFAAALKAALALVEVGEGPAPSPTICTSMWRACGTTRST